MDVPYTSDGLTVVNVEHGGYGKLKFTFRNDTAQPLGDMSYMVVKFLNENKVVVDSQHLYIDDLNPGESCVKVVWFNYATRSISFGETRLVSADESSMLGSIPTVAVGNMELNSPYTREGLTFTAIKTWSDRVLMQIRNDNDLPVMSAYIEYKTFDKNGQVLNSNTAWLPMLDPGETAQIDFYCGHSVKTLIFGKVTISEGKASGEIATEKNRNLVSNILPADVGGIVFSKLSLSGRHLDIDYTNNSGMAITSSSKVYYKTYDAEDYVLESGSIYLPDMNPGQSGHERIYVEKATAKILFFGAELVEGEIIEKPATVTVKGVEVNATPYTTNGLTIEEIIVKGSKFDVLVRNNTGAAISSASIEFRCLDKNGAALDTRTLYIGGLNPGEAELINSYMTSKSKAVIFGAGTYYEGEAWDVSMTCRDIRKNLIGNLPYACNGIEVTFSRTFNNYFEATVTNNTGSTIQGGSLPYRCYNVDGVIIENGSSWLENMAPGESCLIRVNCPAKSVKIIFGTPNFW